MKQSKSLVIKYYLFSFLTGIWLSGPVLIPFFKEWGGLNQFQIQLLQSWCMVVLSLVMIPTGVFADRYGRRKSIVIGLLLGTIACIWYGSIGGFIAFFIGEVAFALHQGFIIGADRALLTSLLKKSGNKTRVSSVFATSFIFHMVGLIVSAPIGRWLAGFGLNLPVVLSAIPNLLAILVILTLPESTNGHHSTTWVKDSMHGLSYLIRNPRHRRAVLAAITTSTAAYFVYWLYQDIIVTLAPSDPLTASTIAFITLISGEVAISLVFRHLSDTHQQHFLTIGRWLVPAGLLTLLLFPGWLGFYIFIFLSGSIGLSYWSMFLAQLQEHLPEESQAAVNSGADTLRQLGLIISNPLIGALAVRHPQPGLIAITCIAILAVLIKPRT
jgi:MFS family permease